jgi:hypothetical protein
MVDRAVAHRTHGRKRDHVALFFCTGARLPVKFAMYSAYDRSIFSKASALAFSHSNGSVSQSGLLSGVWSPRWRGDTEGQPKSLTTRSIGGSGISNFSSMTDRFVTLEEEEESDMIAGGLQVSARCDALLK